MADIAFFVDGHLEKKFIQIVCPRAIVRMLQCNGRDVHVSAIAKRIATHSRMLRGKYYPLVIIVDLEGRSVSSREFCSALLTAVREENVEDKIILGVPDRMIENWMLADKETVLEKSGKTSLDISSPDGFNGKSVLKKHLGSYRETTVGVKLLKSCRPSAMKRSPSFLSFYKQVKNIDCWWLGR